MKKRYKVSVEEVWTQIYTVMADSEDEAKELVLRGDSPLAETLEFSHINSDPHTMWATEIESNG